MPTPGSGGSIALSDIHSEFALGGSYSLYRFYSLSTGTGTSSLMFHNLDMGLSGTEDAKDAIWQTFNSGNALPISNWHNYSQTPDVVIDWTIINNSAYNVNVTLELLDSSSALVSNIIIMVVNAGNTAAGTSTGPNTTTVGAGGYIIALANVSFLPPGPVPPAVWTISFSVSASDTDGVGGGTNRSTYTPPNYSDPPGGAYGTQIIVDDGGGAIAINKRTTFDVTIT